MTNQEHADGRCGVSDAEFRERFPLPCPHCGETYDPDEDPERAAALASGGTDDIEF
jgi:hypothetical protein